MQGILFTSYNNIFNIDNIAHKYPRFGSIIVLLVEVRRHSPPQVLRLAHINNRALFIEVLVHTGTVGQEGKNIFDILRSG